MSALPQDAVHTGFWVDYSRGSILGATFTSSGNIGNIVIALSSILLSFAGSHLWDLIAFPVYVLRSTNHPTNALHHQHQLLLRNASSPGAYVLESVKAIWYWRHKVRMPEAWRQFILPIILAVLCSWGFLVAGIFASQIVSTSDIMALADSPRCAYLASATGDSSYETTGRENELWSQNSALHITNTLYAQECYNTSERLSQCNIYATQNLPVSSQQVPCPFEDLCFGTNGTALMQESSLIDSHLDLGINSRPENRVQWQSRLICAPLDSNRFLRTLNATEEDPMFHEEHTPLPGEIAYQYALGPQLTKYDHDNVTLRLDNYTTNLYESYTDYILTHDPGDQWINNYNATVPALKKSDATVVLIAIASNALLNLFPIDDPIFAAHQETTATWNGQNQTVYKSDDPVGIVACQDQHRFCFSGRGCTDFRDYGTAAGQALSLANPVQNATLQWLFLSIPGLYVISSGSNVPALRALSTVESAFQWAPLPINQWEIEVLNIWPLRAAWVQSMGPLIAVGASTLQSSGSYEQPLTQIQDPRERALCKAIKMQAPQGYVNIDVFGLAFIVVVCGLIILANLAITPLFKILARNGKRDMPRVRRWIQDGMLHVLRKAYEGVGYGDWEQTWRDVPPTLKAHYRMVTLADSETSSGYHVLPMTRLNSHASSAGVRSTSNPTQLVSSANKSPPVTVNTSQRPAQTHSTAQSPAPQQQQQQQQQQGTQLTAQTNIPTTIAAQTSPQPAAAGPPTTSTASATNN